MRKLVAIAAALAALSAVAGAGAAPPQGYQPDDAFSRSYAANHVQSVQATAQQTSCYTPETPYFDALTAADGYPDGGMSPCNGSATTGENLGPYATQDKTVANPMRVKDHSESDIRVDPKNPLHVIGMSKWFVSAEGYNHLTGFYESFDGGQTWPVQGHTPGYEGWTDNTDPVGAFDPWGNFYSLALAYEFYYSKSGGHVYNNGSNQTNATVPPEVVAMSVRKAGGGVNGWITTHNGRPDYLMTAKNANTGDPDKQWVTIDDNPSSPHYGRIYAMWTVFVLGPSLIYESHADARADGTHTDWSTPQVLPTVSGKRWDTYLLPHVAPDGTVWTTTTNNPSQQGYTTASISLIWSKDGGATWQGPLTVSPQVNLPTYQNTTFREGIVNTFAVGTKKVGANYPLYVSYEDGGTGLSNVYLTASYDNGQTWAAPILVNDNQGPTEALQPNLNVAPNGDVDIAFYDRRLACPAAGSAEAAAAGLAFDPLAPFGRTNYCLNAALQFYKPNLTPIGHNVRLSAHTWDAQLSAPFPSSIGGASTFIGDYFGIDSGGAYTYTSSVTTYNGGLNPSFHQQQDVARIATP
jgi:hypothetical protein